MSIETPNSDADPQASRTITLSKGEGDSTWSAVDEDLGVASVGDTREEALQNLDEAVALHIGDTGASVDTPEEEREVLDDLGIDPDEVNDAREDASDVPEFMQ